MCKRTGMHDNDRTYVNNFALVYSQYSKYVSDSINRMVMNRELSEEISQDVFLKLFEKRTPLEPGNPTLKAFLTLVAKHRAIDFIKRNQREDRAMQNIAIETVECGNNFYSDLENAYIEGEVLSTLHDVLQELPSVERSIIVNRFFYRKTLTQISHDIERSSTTVTKLFNNAKNQLRNKISAYYTP